MELLEIARERNTYSESLQMSDHRALVRSFKLRGFALTENALASLSKLLSSRTQRERKELLSEIFNGIDRSTLLNGQVTLDHIKPFTDRYMMDLDTPSNTYFYKVVDAFDAPRFSYSVTRKNFETVGEHGVVFGSANDKADMYEERYLLVLQRLRRKKFFSGENSLTPIESLLGQTGERFVLGFLSQLSEGQFYLEDNKSHVKIDVSHLQGRSGGMFTEGGLVVAKGLLVDDVFRVSTLALPPYEAQELTETTFPGIDFFGSRPPLRIMQEIEEQAKYYIDTNMYILSDVWLDNRKVMTQLRVLFVGLESNDVIPDVIVFMGNFTSRPFGHEHADSSRLKHYYQNLAELISQFPKIAKTTKFVFIPGPTDPGPNVLPRPALPSYLTVILFRDDLAHKMRRHCLLEPVAPPGVEEEIELYDHLVETLASASHLCPLVETSKPIYWNYDHAMRLYPLPDALVIGDQFQSYETEYDSCLCLNPGPFHIDYSFINYEPFQHASELSQVPEVGTA